jgi:hypothetical protein
MRVPIIAARLAPCVLVVLALVAGCRHSDQADGMADTTFVAVMAALKNVRDAPGIDSATRALRRDSILQRRGLEPAQLEAAARRLAQNPARAQTVWQAVERKASDTTRTKPAPVK